MTTVNREAVPATGDERAAVEPPRRRRRLLWPALGAVIVTAAGVTTWLSTGNTTTESPAAATAPVATATVVRATISATERRDGTLDHGPPTTVRSGTAGTVTRLAGQGTTVQSGTELFRVDERPVTVLRGAVPMYRNLAPGDSGADVEQLERNLAELGYGGLTVDDRYTASTDAAVRAWQAAIGAEQTGTVARGDVVFLPEAGRVDVLRIDVGDVVTPGAAVLDLTGTAKVASLQVDLADRERFAAGGPVTVVLPGDEEVPGTVSAATVVEVAAEPNAGDDQPQTKAMTAVRIALSRDVDDGMVGAPVEVVVAVDERADVLLVPVNALLALSEGGYGLEVVGEGGTTRIVAVDTGLFAEGKVQVTGEGIDEGTVVGVAGR